MTEETVELARRYYEAFDAADLAATAHLRHPEIEVFDLPDLPDADRHVGEPAVRELIASFVEMGWDGKVRDPEYIDAGEEVVVIWRLSAHSTHEGFPIEATLVHVCEFEDGKLRRLRQFRSRSEGLDAAGLTEDD